jgi:hypothetical protein
VHKLSYLLTPVAKVEEDTASEDAESDLFLSEDDAPYQPSADETDSDDDSHSHRSKRRKTHKAASTRRGQSSPPSDQQDDDDMPLETYTQRSMEANTKKRSREPTKKPAKKPGRKTPRKLPKSGSRPTNPREYYQQKIKRDSAKQQTRKASKPSRSSQKGRRKRQDAALATASTVGVNDLFTNLMGSNTIEDWSTLPRVDPAPSVPGRQRKDAAYKQLRQNIPQTANRRITATEYKDIVQASKSFGVHKVIAKDSMWQLKGLKTLLYHHQLLGAAFMVSDEMDRGT